MLQISYIRENTEEVLNRLRIKNFDGKELVNQVITIDESRRETQKKLDDLLAESNTIAKQVGVLMQQKKAEEAIQLKERSNNIKEESKLVAIQLSEIESELQDILVRIPNLPHVSVPAGASPQDNLIDFEYGTIPNLPETAKPHWDLASQYDIIDFELGVKVTGAGFPFYKGQGARLQRALINFFLNEAIQAGYTEYQPPYFVNEDSGYGTGQLPDKEGQMYHMTQDNFYAIPTAEVPLTNIFRNEIYKASDLPFKITAYSPCWRREAGSYGKDVRGLNRLHQFDKVEIVHIENPENSYQTLEAMKEHVKGLLMKLELPFRILRLCGGDMSFTSSLTFDFEVYSAAQKRWLEVSSVSNFESFQANRMKLRFKDVDGKTKLCHTLNGSALALPRIVAALLENNQTSEGIRIPKALQAYTGFEFIK